VYNVFKISGATLYDHATIKANMRALYREKYHCCKDEKDIENRIERFKNEKPEYLNGLKNELDKRRKYKGCGIVLNRVVDKIDNYIFKTCLCKIEHPIMNDLLTMEKNYSIGVMPFNGGLLEQPAQIIELLEITHNARISEKTERQKECQLK
jgi:hypothetical protein